MKIAIMQPYFFPYLGYFGLIKYTQKFILLDTVQFIRHGWIERNRILKPGEGWQYICVPLVKHHQKTIIKDIKINNCEKWRDKIFAQLNHYKKKAPYYTEAVQVIRKALDIDTDNITELNFNILKNVCEYIEIPFDCEIFSEMNLDIIQPENPDEWALNICLALKNVDEYINPQGGTSFFSKSKYEQNNIKLNFYKQTLPFYSQRRGRENFEEGLSIIDVMMFNPVNDIKKMLDNYEIL